MKWVRKIISEILETELILLKFKTVLPYNKKDKKYSVKLTLDQIRLLETCYILGIHNKDQLLKKQEK